MSMTEVIESIEKDMWRQVNAGTTGKEPENPRYCCNCKFYMLDDGTCRNKKSDFCGQFQNLDSTCGDFEETE